MMQNLKKTIYCCLFYILLALALANITKITNYTRNALIQWYQTILPSQFITIVMLNFLKSYQVKSTKTGEKSTLLGLIFCGFLFGFPSGAILTSNAYKAGKLRKRTALLLMPVCNVFGPAYLFGFVYPTYQKSFEKYFCLKDFLIAIYGLPLIYLLFALVLSSIPSMMDSGKTSINEVPDSSKNSETLRNMPGQCTFQDIIMDSLITTAKLAGYMMFFSSFQFIGDLLPLSGFHLLLFKSCFEVTTASQLLGAQFPVIFVFFIAFGCLSGIAQTSCILTEFGLPIFPYILQKLLLAFLGMLFLGFV